MSGRCPTRLSQPAAVLAGKSEQIKLGRRPSVDFWVVRLSWNEVRVRATAFAEQWRDAADEVREAQSFYNDFFRSSTSSAGAWRATRSM